MRDVSVALVVCFKELSEKGGWATSAEIAEKAQVAPRTARKQLQKLVRQGVVEEVQLYPSYRYRVIDGSFRERIAQAADAFGVPL